jgi:hypothetical protein
MSENSEALEALERLQTRDYPDEEANDYETVRTALEQRWGMTQGNRRERCEHIQSGDDGTQWCALAEKNMADYAELRESLENMVAFVAVMQDEAKHNGLDDLLEHARALLNTGDRQRISQEWLRKRTENDPDDAEVEAGSLHPDMLNTGESHENEPEN